MKDIANHVGSFGSEIADRIAQWAQNHPEASEYCLNTEEEAIELLVTIAATIKAMMNSMPPQRAKEVRPIRNGMIMAARQKRAIAYIRQLNQSDPLEFLGLRITVPEEVIH